MRSVCLFAALLAGCGSNAPRPEPIPPRPPSPPSSEQARLFADQSNAFGLDLWARLHTTPGNQIFSPASIAMALDMTYGGARGETAAQMAHVLHVEGVSQEDLHAAAGNVLSTWNDPSRDSYQLAVANRLFGERSFRFEQPFLQMTADRYNAPFEPTNFRAGFEPARVHINDWVAVQTHDRIRDLIPVGALTSDTRMVLTNAVYFLGKWEQPFEANATAPRAFYADGTREVQAPTMAMSHGGFRYAEAPGVQILEMPYRGGEIAMTIVLPSERNGLGAIESQLTPQTLASWVGALQPQSVDVTMPKFRIAPADSIALASELTAMGMPLAFDDHQADLSGIGVPPDPDHVLYISNVFHKAFVQVDEEGTEAAAATAVVVAETASAMMPGTQFNADHPFLFFIRDVRSGAVLFLGRLVDPTA